MQLLVKERDFKSGKCFLKVKSIISFGTEGWGSLDFGYASLFRSKRRESFDFFDL